MSPEGKITSSWEPCVWHAEKVTVEPLESWIELGGQSPHSSWPFYSPPSPGSWSTLLEHHVLQGVLTCTYNCTPALRTALRTLQLPFLSFKAYSKPPFLSEILPSLPKKLLPLQPLKYTYFPFMEPLSTVYYNYLCTSLYISILKVHCLAHQFDGRAGPWKIIKHQWEEEGKRMLSVWTQPSVHEAIGHVEGLGHDVFFKRKV